MTIAILTPTLTVTDRSMVEALRTWWDARQADPDCALAFADNAPQNFTELCTRIITGAYILYLVCDDAGEVAGAMWLHDIHRMGRRIRVTRFPADGSRHSHVASGPCALGSARSPALFCRSAYRQHPLAGLCHTAHGLARCEALCAVHALWRSAHRLSDLHAAS